MDASEPEEYLRDFTPDRRRVGWLLAKALLRHPLLMLRTFLMGSDLSRQLAEYAPGVSFGRSDHPLDVDGPIGSFLTALPKLLLRRAACVLRVELAQRQANRFLFRARGYDIFRLIPPQDFYRHVYTVDEQTPCTRCTLVLDFLREDAYRLRLVRGDELLEHETPMVSREIRDPDCKVELAEDESSYTLSTSALTVRIFKRDFRIEVFDAAGNKLTQTGGRTDNGFGMAFDAYPLGFIRDRRTKQSFAVESFELAHDEAIYGLGEHFGRLNKVGQTLRLWITEGVGNTSGRVYKAVPFFVSTRGYGAFFNHSQPITFWVGTKEHSKTELAVEDDQLDYFFFAGGIKEVLGLYTQLTGRASVPPKFSFGTWVSRMSYREQEEVLSVARKLRDRRFPADVIHIDDDWFTDAWCCDWQFDPKRFPDPRAMCAQLAAMGFHVSIWQEPYVLKETALWSEAQRKGYLATSPVPFVFVSKYECAPIDFTNPQACRWYQERLLRPLLELGIDVIKTDFGEGIEPGMRFQHGDGHALHNVYPLLYNRAAYEITEQVHGEAMVWGRAAYAGSQRYPVVWSGDNSASFGSMASSLRGGLSLGMCGFSFWSQDTGGFVGEPTDVLYIRWTQLSIFQSHFRYHGCYPYREPWKFSNVAQEIVRDFLNLRYRLIPYLYSEAIDSARRGLPLLRALVVEYAQDPTTHAIDDQFLCGRHILVAPVLGSGAARRVYLPAGRWYDFFTGEVSVGPCWLTRTSSLERIPVFVCAGTILPLGPAVQSTSELGEDFDLELQVYFDERGRASYVLREGETQLDLQADYRQGQVELDAGDTPRIRSITAYTCGG